MLQTTIVVIKQITFVIDRTMLIYYLEESQLLVELWVHWEEVLSWIVWIPQSLMLLRYRFSFNLRCIIFLDNWPVICFLILIKTNYTLQLLSTATFFGGIFCFSAFCFSNLYFFMFFFLIGEILVFATQVIFMLRMWIVIYYTYYRWGDSFDLFTCKWVDLCYVLSLTGQMGKQIKQL